MNGAPQPRPPSVYIVAGEESGDALGAALARALLARAGATITLAGVGGGGMAAAGIVSPFPIAEIGSIGITTIARRLPMILRRIRETADRIVAEPALVTAAADREKIFFAGVAEDMTA